MRKRKDMKLALNPFKRRGNGGDSHRDVFAEFAMRLLGYLVTRRLPRGTDRPRFRVVR
jgi:hypothetical protein